MNFYSPEYDKSLDADLIIERGDDTFVCFRKRETYKGDAVDTENWRIVLYRTFIHGNAKYTQMLFPYGRTTFEFAPNKIDTYTFEFAQ